LADLVLVRAGSLPRTSSGKPERHRVAELYNEGQFMRLNPLPPDQAARTVGAKA
jgi:hypothetical protein